jgi:hypothetical protein
MKRLLVIFVCLVATSAGVASPVRPTITPAEVPPGAQGMCRTEMEGGEMVEVPVTVLGTLGGATPEGEMVLVRLDDERFERTGIIAGMSGSPVYVNGRLLGALAFGWPFSKDPIGGVTPFDRMRELGTSGPSLPEAGGSRPPVESMVRAMADGTLGQAMLDWLAPSPAAGIRGLPLALSTGGMGLPSGWMAQAWERLGLLSAGGAGASERKAVDTGPLEPGAMVAGIMASGDVTLTVGGTVTEVEGDQFWAFGHPFLGGGAFPMTLARARVITVLPSQMSSFKFYSVGEPIGAFRVDRLHGVWGKLGETVAPVPIQVSVDDRSYHFDCVRHPILLPLLAGYLTQVSHFARGRQFGEQTLTVRAEATLADATTVAIEETFATPDAPALAAGVSTMLLAYLEGAPVAVPEIASVRITLHTAERIEQAEVIEAVPERTMVRPGDRLGVMVRLRRHQGGDEVRRYEVVVPADSPRGRLDLVVADGASWTKYDLKMRPQSPATVADEIGLIERLVPSNRLVLALERRDPGVALSGGPLSTPPSVQLAMRSGLSTNLAAVTHRVVAESIEKMPYAVLGAARLPLLVRFDGPDGEPEPGPEEPQ